ncbi:polysaccharide deacetylase [Virgibacillus profundi]|uniref:Polysaccharide deacetylase n=1 Tax=Virgibacillus profundi TaxID=2024555 RepID=A0A2A2IEY1_9BACI|nr:polysaccharide deacetylase family protein [Virgibacillus profundi]PAV29866.1 polysaccharide deacetylase [Virgibacillus profundi]PXY54038.1 polysaccharide deacetylase family protein [Virgibacillus profundi]
MKQIVRVLFLSLLIVLAACNSDEPVSNESAENKEGHQEEEQEQETDIADEKTEVEEVEDEENEMDSKEKESEPLYKVSDNWSIVPIDEGTDEKVILLTIDDAPDQYAVEMAKTLKELDVNAIFFVNGHFLDTPEEEAKLKEIHDMGFIIGNHTYSHPLLSDISDEEQKEEIVELNNRVEEIIGERPKFFRAPHGVNTDFSKQIVEEEGMKLMNWSFGYDWEEQYRTKEALTDIMVNTELLGNGSNLLMHDREWTAAALESIVTGLQNKGYENVDPNLIQTK